MLAQQTVHDHRHLGEQGGGSEVRLGQRLTRRIDLDEGRTDRHDEGRSGGFGDAGHRRTDHAEQLQRSSLPEQRSAGLGDPHDLELGRGEAGVV